MNRTLLAMIVSITALAGLFGLLLVDEPTLKAGPVVMYCAASNRAVMEAIKADYEKEMADLGYTLEIQYGPSQTLLSSIEVSHTGDLYLPADDSYLTMARDKKLVAEILPIARQQGVIAVKKGNPLSINSIEDLFRDDVRLLQANPEAAAIGKIARKVLKEQGLWDKLDKATTAYRTTVTEVANDIVVGAADAGIVYDAVLHTYPDLEFVEVPELKNAASDISVGVIADTKQSARALHFARYISARDRGLEHYSNHGFRVKEGDEWADKPEFAIFAGSMLRPAIDDTITAFQEREGVTVLRDYNGCGILVAQMKAGQKPDAYFACDTEFMQQVPDLFPESIDVSQNELVIVVNEGNPLEIASLQDLTKPDVRVGVGHEKKCAMGWLTQNTLQEAGIHEEVMANVEVKSSTGDLLVNQVRAGSLDAAVVYLSNAAGSQDYVDAVQLQGLECNVATQPFAIAQQSRYRRLVERLFEQICSAQSKDGFEKEGFRWQLEESSSGDAQTD